MTEATINRTYMLRAAGFLFAIAMAMSHSAAAQGFGNKDSGRAIADAICADCHGVRPDDIRSIHPTAPHFESIADTPGFTAATLRGWMQSSHPTMPNIILSPTELTDVIEYILSLKSR